MIDRALVRFVPDSFPKSIVSEGAHPLDTEVARSQHDTYRLHLRNAGYEVEELAADESCPDCVFIEDTAVIIGSVAVITRPGAPSRRAECEPVAEALIAYMPVVYLEEPATLDGGDVFSSGGRTFVGRSRRTNQHGIDQLAEVAQEQGFSLAAVDVYETLHLKSAVLPIDQETVVLTRGCVDEAALEGLRLVYEDDTERHRFSALPLVNGSLLVTGNALRTASSLAGLGFDPVPIDVSQLQAADGGLTCMSILFTA